MEKTASQILNEAADLLEEEGRWGKGRYFRPGDSNKGCIMCAHGAIAYCGNPRVKELAQMSPFNGAPSLVNKGLTLADISPNSSIIETAQKENLTTEQYFVKHYGELAVAHYKAYQVGLSVDFNDSVRTTKEQVIAKLREAASASI
jgi:hypothetical protein